jgi:hypothetical protein
MKSSHFKSLVRSRFESDTYVSAMQDHLLAIRKANSMKERQAAAGAYGGFRRAQRSWAKRVLAQELMTDMEITQTIHVAKFVMRRAFGQAIGNDDLERYFAEAGRDAKKKYMDEAKNAVAGTQTGIARYAKLYEWFVQEEQQTAMRIGMMR